MGLKVLFGIDASPRSPHGAPPHGAPRTRRRYLSAATTSISTRQRLSARRTPASVVRAGAAPFGSHFTHSSFIAAKSSSMCVNRHVAFNSRDLSVPAFARRSSMPASTLSVCERASVMWPSAGTCPVRYTMPLYTVAPEKRFVGETSMRRRSDTAATLLDACRTARIILAEMRERDKNIICDFLLVQVTSLPRDFLRVATFKLSAIERESQPG